MVLIRHTFQSIYDIFIWRGIHHSQREFKGGQCNFGTVAYVKDGRWEGKSDGVGGWTVRQWSGALLPTLSTTSIEWGRSSRALVWRTRTGRMWSGAVSCRELWPLFHYTILNMSPRLVDGIHLLFAIPSPLTLGLKLLSHCFVATLGCWNECR